MMILILKMMVAAQASPNDFFGDLESFKSKSLRLETRQAQVEAHSKMLLSKKLFWTPTLSVSAEKSETRVDSVKIGSAESLSANLNLNLFRGGADWNAMKGAEAQKKASELELQSEALKVEVTASDLIFKTLYMAESKRIEEQLLKMKEESLRIIKDRYGQGKTPLQEVTKSEVDLIQQKNKLRNTILDLSENKSHILSLFISEVQTRDWPFTEKTRPKLQGAETILNTQQKYWVSQSRERSWKASKGLHWPSLDFRLQYQASPLKNLEQKELVGLLTLSFPLWDQYSKSAQVSLEYASYIDALNDFKETEQSLTQRELFLKEKIESARMNLEESKKNVQTSRRLYDDVLRSFRLGRISTNDLIIEQNRLLDSENNLALSQLNFHQGLIETCALLGLKAADCLE